VQENDEFISRKPINIKALSQLHVERLTLR